MARHSRVGVAVLGWGLVVLLAALALVLPAAAADNETCLMCHGDSDLTAERNGRSVSMFVDEGAFGKSVHSDVECIYCHQDADVEDFPHEEDLEDVFCGTCHDDTQLDFDASIHGLALRRNQAYAPDCSDCHGVHDILSPTDPASPAFKMNIPYLCGGCHREGAPVARVYDIAEHNIIENYSQSIHGEGLFKKGLTVTATCTSCHSSHRVLPHTDPNSTISPRNISGMCMTCHSRIEEVHTQVIRGELWEKAPGAIPSCTDCHTPHKVRKELLTHTLSDRECLKCHAEPDVFKVADGDTLSMTVHKDIIEQSVHENIPCVKCHTDVDPRKKRPCETSGRAECSNCHAKMAEEYAISGHGVAFEEGKENAPYCTTCHGDHAVMSHRDEEAETFRARVPELCGECHKQDNVAMEGTHLTQGAAFADYSSSVHGRGLSEKGLLPSAVCIDCHNSHMVLGRNDERSTVFTENIAATCGTCHRGIYKEFTKSIHYSHELKEGEKLPTCADCHSPHTIQETGEDQFMTEITHQCGSCHGELSETYLDTMHGKAYRLGYLESAKCSDCHGAHAILSHNDPESSVGFRNIVQTCQKCHADANMRFTGYLTHATHHDRTKYPFLFYTFWGMTTLLVGVFLFFGIHTLLWLPRSFREYRARKKRHEAASEPRYYIRRFTRTQRITHLFVITSFLSLALTGMMLKFSSMQWAGYVAGLLGGVKGAGIIHRTAAVVTFGYFIAHLIALVVYKRKRRLSLFRLIFNKNSMMFGKKDLQDFWGTMKWFVGAGPRPNYGRWTYWEKFDYLAVFWGVAMIGFTGLMLWFPEFFTKFMPGSLINVAHIIHSDEALLAVGFIFTIHFFNTHLRPEAFPMDTVVFTGVAPLDEYKNDRPQEYAELRASGELGKRVTRQTVSRRKELLIRVAGYTFLAIGLTIIALIVYSMLFGYK